MGMGMAEPSSLVELTEVSRLFGSDPPVAALRAINLSIEAGESVAIVGPSGSGKSTLLNVLGLLDRATSGLYRLGGIDVSQLSDRERAGVRGRQIGFVFQSFHLLPYRTAVENVMLAEVYLKTPRSGRRRRAEEMLDRVGMSHRLTFPPSRMSGGERQRVAIARALMAHPALVLCDEPTGNLDSRTTAELLALFEGLVDEGITLVTITHDVEVAAHAGRRLRMVDGELSEVEDLPVASVAHLEAGP
jgi:ABC-type lipoprotein export system ATPase subunit